MKFTTEQMLVLLNECTSYGDEERIATMLGELCRFWDGPTLGLEPEVKVWTVEGRDGYCCTFKFYRGHDEPPFDHVAMAKHITSLRYEGVGPLFSHVNVETETSYGHSVED